MTALLVGILVSGCGRTTDHGAEPGPSDLTLVGADIGASGVEGYVEPNVELVPAKLNSVRLAGAGADIAGREDAFFFGYVEVADDVTLEARAIAIEGGQDDAKAGIMIRSSVRPNAGNVLLAVTPAGRVSYQIRDVDGGDTSVTEDETASGLPLWLRIVRKGDAVSAFSSRDGTTYRLHSTSELALNESFYIGLAVTSHRADELATADFDMLWVDPDRALIPTVVGSEPQPAPAPTSPPANTTPLAVADAYSLPQGSVLAVSAESGVLANDTDPDGDVLTASIVEAPSSGELRMDADGSFTFTPPPSFVGSVDFIYRASDPHGATATASVSLDVSEAPGDVDEPDGVDAPEAVEADIFVALHGSDDASGSMTEPFATIQRAVDEVGPGDTILLRGGVYYLSDPLRLREGGTESATIVMASYPGERAILDGSRMVDAKPIVKLTSSYWHLRDLELREGRYFGMYLEHATHNLIERVESHHNGHSGFHLAIEASFNTILDSDSHHNYDPASGGQHADGFAIKHTTARDNLLLRTRAWNNSDDGYDLLDSPPQRIDQSVAFRNGLQDDGTPYPNGNGNGFKLGIGEGRYVSGGGHYVTRSVAWENETWGFNSNNGTVPITLHNNTGWNNGWYDFFFNKGEHVLVNNLAFGGKVWTSSEVVTEANSWTLGITDPQFSSTLPSSPDFLLLSSGSDAIDEGATLGLPFDGAAPDLGAYEFGTDPVVLVGIDDHEWTAASAFLAPR